MVSKAGIKRKTAGNIDKEGYRRIKINGELYPVSRLAWFYMEGYWPEYQIDHINRVKDDNRWENLRHVSGLCNTRNASVAKNNRSGITGVHWCKKSSKWCAKIGVLWEMIGLGYFKSKTDAVYARWQAEVEYGFPECNTTSSAYLYLKSQGG